jgi:phosphate transport system substrate-binding protein
MKRVALVLGMLIGASAGARAVEAQPAAASAPEPPSGVVRIWGNAEMTALVEQWQVGLRKEHTNLALETHLTGSDVGMAALYTGKADVALLGREATANEIKAFEWIFRFKPTAIQVATGSLDAPGKSPALVAFVHRDNPLASVTLAQLDAAFGHERLRGAARSADTWDALGLTGEWANQPINLYLFDTESGSGRHFRKAVLEDSRMLNWERLREFTDRGRPGTQSHDADAQILDALAQDRFGLAVSSLARGGRNVHALSIATREGVLPVAATRATLMARSYPLTRFVYAYVKRAPDSALDVRVGTVLRHVLGSEGQKAIEREGHYLPLPPQLANEQLAGLK